MFLCQKDDNINNDYSHLTCFIDKQMFAVESVNCSTVSSAVQCSAVKCCAVQCSKLHCSAKQCSALQCSAVQCSKLHCSAKQYREAVYLLRSPSYLHN